MVEVHTQEENDWLTQTFLRKGTCFIVTLLARGLQ